MPTQLYSREHFANMAQALPDPLQLTRMLREARKNYGTDFVKQLVDEFDLARFGLDHTASHWKRREQHV